MFSFSDYITDSESAQVVECLRKLCNSSNVSRSPITLLGPSGVGKTYLCKAINLECENTIYCTAEDFGSFPIYILENDVPIDHFFEVFENCNVIIDDVDSLVFYSQIIRIHGKLVETRGKIMQALISELVLRQQTTENYVVLTFNYVLRRDWHADYFEEILQSGETFYLQYPDRRTRIRYCKMRLFDNHIDITNETAAVIIDFWNGNSIPRINAIVNNIVARKKINEMDSIFPD